MPETLTTPDQIQAMGVDEVSIQLQELIEQTPKSLATNDPADADADADGPSSGSGASKRSKAKARNPIPQQPEPEPPQQARLARAIQRTADVFGVPVVSLMLKTAGSGVRCAIAGMPERGGWQTEAMPPAMSPLGRVLLGAGALRLNDLHNDPRHLGESHPVYPQRGFFSGVPLLDKAGNVVGVLALHAPAGHALDAAESGLLSQLAQDMSADAVALINAIAATMEPDGQQEPSQTAASGCASA